MFYVVPFFFSFFLLHLSRSLWFYLSTPRNQPTGFKRVTTQNNSAAHAYCHHLFQRERPNLCTKMKGDGGLRATDEERQAAAAVGIDPRRAAGIEGLTPAQLAQRQVELEMERRLRKAGVDVDSEKKKSPVPPPAYAAPAAPAAPSVPASAADGVGGTGTAGASAVAAGATAFVHPTPSTALAQRGGTADGRAGVSTPAPGEEGAAPGPGGPLGGVEPAKGYRWSSSRSRRTTHGQWW